MVNRGKFLMQLRAISEAISEELSIQKPEIKQIKYEGEWRNQVIEKIKAMSLRTTATDTNNKTYQVILKLMRFHFVGMSMQQEKYRWRIAIPEVGAEFTVGLILEDVSTSVPLHRKTGLMWINVSEVMAEVLQKI